MDDRHPIENHDRAPWQSEAEKQQEKKPRDAIPSVTFRGHVDSFQPGTGSGSAYCQLKMPPATM